MRADFDVCVVGAGAGGAVAAWALVKKGLQVVLLETGRRFDPATYRTHAHDWRLRGSSFADADAFERNYESAPGEALDPSYAHLASRSPTVFAAPNRTHRLPFYHERAIGVGGTTLHYEGEAHRFPAHAFRMRSQRGVGDDWPISYEDLAPYYERVEQLLGVAGDPHNPFKPPRRPYPYAAHPLSAASRKIERGAEQIGLRLLPNSLAILPEPRPGRAACHYCNGCARGCDVAAKGSVDVAVIPEAEATGRLTLMTGMHACRLEHRPDGRIANVIVADEGRQEQRIAARAFVLATGAIETPRLLLNSTGGVYPHGVGNQHDQVGRHLMELLYVSIGAMFDASLATFNGVPIDSRIWDLNGATGRAPVPNGIVLGHQCGEFIDPVGYALEGAEGFGAAHRAAMRRRFGAGIELFGVAEQLPRSENRVTLADGRDPLGMPRARVTTRLDRADLDALSAVYRSLRELADASGLKEIVRRVTAYDVSSATHVGGTCRMGIDRERSVVDSFCRVHGIPNLIVADASVLVTQGAGDSPSLTIQALALRSADDLADRVRRGEV